MIRKGLNAFIFILFSSVVAFEDTIKLWQETNDDSSLCLLEGESENNEEPIEEKGLEDLFEEYYPAHFELLSWNEIDQQNCQWPIIKDNPYNNCYIDILIPPPKAV